MKIAVFGANGLVGSHAVRYFSEIGHKVITVNHSSGKADYFADASDLNSVRSILHESKPDVVFNAVKSSLSTDASEFRKPETWQSNVIVPQTLALVSSELRIKFVHLSSAWVYEGLAGVVYSENSITYPLNFYSYSKAIAEERVASCCRNSIILRADSVFGIDSRGANFFSRLKISQEEHKEFHASKDQICQPIYAGEISRLTEALLNAGSTGIFNCVSPDLVSRYDFALRICKAFDFDRDLVIPAISSVRAIRIPENLKLDIQKINSVCKVKPLDSQIKDLRELLQ